MCCKEREKGGKRLHGESICSLKERKGKTFGDERTSLSCIDFSISRITVTALLALLAARAFFLAVHLRSTIPGLLHHSSHSYSLSSSSSLCCSHSLSFLIFLFDEVFAARFLDPAAPAADAEPLWLWGAEHHHNRR